METNSLVYTTTKIAKNGEQFIIKIRLNDECKNGHQDFSITGTIYEAGKVMCEKNMIGCDTIGEKIAKEFPEFAIFNDLHLCDYKGIPTHCSANGYYHLKNGFNSKSTGENFIKEYCQYYRLSTDEFNILSKAYSEVHFAILLEKLNIFQKWEKQANEAIKELERLTGNTFVVDSIRTQYHRPTQEQIDLELERIANGYYSIEQIEKRLDEKKQAKINQLKIDTQKAIDKINLEFEIDKIMLEYDEKIYENYIFYSHTNEIKFNWKGYGSLPNEVIEKAKAEIKLPEGVKFK
jgi:hypothetical protein